MAKDYYKILSVTKDSSQAEIKKSFRKLALKHHPDRNQGKPESEAKFKEVAAAYEILGNAKKRAQYDQYGHAGVESRFGQSGFHDVQDIFSSFKDIFEGGNFNSDSGGGGFSSIFGEQRQSNRPSQGSDLRYNLEISLVDVLKGVSETIVYEVKRNCIDCKGTGASPGTKTSTCTECKGSGRLTRKQGFFSFSSTCPTCQGVGTFINSPCGVCFGVGIKNKKEKISVDIPAGIETGMQLRLSQKGEAGNLGGPPGDLYVHITVKEHLLKRREADLIGSIKISYLQALLGVKIKVKSLEGEKEIIIPRGIQHGNLVSLKNEGLPILNSRKRGNLLYQVQIQIPAKLKKKEEAQLRSLAKELGESVLDK